MEFEVPVRIFIDAKVTVTADTVNEAMRLAEATDIKKMDWLSEEVEALEPGNEF